MGFLLRYLNIWLSPKYLYEITKFGYYLCFQMKYVLAFLLHKYMINYLPIPISIQVIWNYFSNDCNFSDFTIVNKDKKKNLKHVFDTAI